MADETLVLTIEKTKQYETKSGKEALHVRDAEKLSGQNPWWVWDKDVAATIEAMVGQSVKVVVNRDSDFATIKKFVGVATGEVPAQPSAPVGSSGGGNPPRGGDGQFRKDPVGVILDLRKTALNNASALVLKGVEEGAMTTDNLKATQDQIVHMSRRYFRELVAGFEGVLGLPAARDQEPVSVGQADENGTNPYGSDDDIPF